MANVSPIPPGYGTVTASVTIRHCGDAIELYREAFGAELLFETKHPDGRVLHAEISIGSSRIMLNDEFPEMGGGGSVQARGGSPVSFWLYVEDADAAFERAIAAGLASVIKPKTMFWGDRSGTLADPFGLRWTVASRVEEVSPEELAARQRETFGG